MIYQARINEKKLKNMDKYIISLVKSSLMICIIYNTKESIQNEFKIFFAVEERIIYEIFYKAETY